MSRRFWVGLGSALLLSLLLQLTLPPMTLGASCGHWDVLEEDEAEAAAAASAAEFPPKNPPAKQKVPLVFRQENPPEVGVSCCEDTFCGFVFTATKRRAGYV